MTRSLARSPATVAPSLVVLDVVVILILIHILILILIIIIALDFDLVLT